MIPNQRMSEIAARVLELSIIIPFYNERENLTQTYEELISVLVPLGKGFELIFIDDGSRDGSSKVIEGIAKTDNRVKLIQFSRNFGQTAAISAGFRHAIGRIYIVIDADNQNDPRDMPLLLAKMDEGFDVVSGWRKDRKDRLITRKIPSFIANKLLSVVTGVRLKDYGCSLKAYRAEYIDAISLYGEMHRFIPAYAHMVGASVVEMPVNHRPRVRGASKYGLIRTLKVIVDLMTVKFLSQYANKPSYLFGGFGGLLCFMGFASAIEVIVEKIFKGTFAHRNPFLLLAVFLFSLGVQLILMGFIAELLVRTYYESQGKTTYLIKKSVNFVAEV